MFKDNKGYYKMKTKTKITLQVFAHNTLYFPLLCTAASPQVTVGGGQGLQEGTEGDGTGGPPGLDLTWNTMEKIGEGKRHGQI